MKLGPMPAYLGIAFVFIVVGYVYTDVIGNFVEIVCTEGIVFLFSILHIFQIQKTLHNITFLSHLKQMEFQKIKLEGRLLSIDKGFSEKIWGSLDQNFFGAGYGYRLFFSQFNLPENRAYYYDESSEFICHIDEKQSFKLLYQIQYSTQDVKYIDGHNYFIPRKSISFWLWRNAPDSIFFLMFLWFKKKLPILYLGKESQTGKYIIISEYELCLFNIIV